MIDWPPDAVRFTAFLASAGVVLALGLAAVVLLERFAFAWHARRRRRLERRYGPLVQRALDGDDAAVRALVGCPRRHRFTVAALLIMPLVQIRDAGRIQATRGVVRAMSLVSVADRLVTSPFWWRRAIALRALGVLQIADRTATIVAALDDPNPDVRGAALDALADLQDPRSLQAIVVRLNDSSLHPGRRAAAVEAFGSRCEPFLLELAGVDPINRAHYARALAFCGTARSRATLCEWTTDVRADVRANAFEALARVALDERAASRAIAALESGDERVRAMAARALRGWEGRGEAAWHLARHLDDAWRVAVEAARSLQSVPAGRVELRARARQSDVAGLLARQMLWEAGTPW